MWKVICKTEIHCASVGGYGMTFNLFKCLSLILLCIFNKNKSLYVVKLLEFGPVVLKDSLN